MEIFGYLAAVLIGVSLGLVGGGGSILTVPVLVYLFHIEPTLATAYSLFIVGASSFFGGIKGVYLKEIDVKTILGFAIPSVISVYVTRYFILPAIPTVVLEFSGLVLTKDIAIMILFAAMMMLASVKMIRHREVAAENVKEKNLSMLIIEGVVVGILTGLVGAGGGFMIVPTLIFFAGMPMRKAIGSSLIIITANSLIGFAADVSNGHEFDYRFLFTITLIAIAGILIGTYLSRKIDGNKLKSGFGWFILLMGIYIISKELFL